ncbi:MAG TPA: cupin domain-containing protein [Trebonia sp.]|nr:cupin domain-containing protein [Trebonia sp.]
MIIRSSEGRGSGSGDGNGNGTAISPESVKTLTLGVTGQAAESQALRLQLVMIPPGTRGMPHFHADHESAIYTVSGETEIWHGNGLVKRTVMRAGDFMYVPPGTPHLAVNRSDVMTITVTASTDPEEREDVVVVELPRHLADVLSFPVAVRE